MFEIQRKPSRRLLIRSAMTGFFVAALGIFLGSFFKLAYEHNALGKDKTGLVSSVLMIVEWPNSILMSFGITRTDFFHPHIRGIGFWHSVLEYYIVNYIGWTILIYLVMVVVRSGIRHHREQIRE